MSAVAGSDIDVVRSFLKALEAGDLDTATSYLDAGVEYQNMPLPPSRGHRGVRVLFAPIFRCTGGFEARINHVAADRGVVLTERTDAVIVGPVRIPFPVCGTFKVDEGKIVLWRDTFDWATVVVNALLAGPRYLFRRAAMAVALRASARS